MAENLFTPKGAEAVWKPLYRFLRDMEYGTVVPYSNLDEILGRDSREDRAPIYQAMREMERHDHRTLRNIPKVGYAIAKPEEHRSESEKHRKRSYRQVKKARDKLASAPRELLPQDELRWIDEAEIRLSQLEMGLRYTNRRVSKLEKKDEIKAEKLAEIQKALDELRERGLLS
jgi:predicted  nucleic acid-binding Zn-ribbon protein